ncbi:universal stress protein [Syntrophus aciditrophicus]|nr:universal stress protein [Syntrophus aciditrophicus]
MAKKFLVALDKSSNSLRAVKFVADNINCAAQITLMSIVPDIAAACELRDPSEVHPLLKENIKDLCVIEEAKTAAMEGFLDEAKKALVNAGFPSENITVCLRRQQTDVAGDILMEAGEGGYDTIVAGRRGVSGVKQFMFGSVSSKIINHAENVSVIVVD